MMELRDGMRVRCVTGGVHTIARLNDDWVAYDERGEIQAPDESTIHEFIDDKFYTLIDAPQLQPEPIRHLPTDAAKRKAVPLYSGLIRYFPDALCEVAELSRIGNEQHNPGAPLHWDRLKSGDELDAAARHLLEAGTRDTDGVRHSTKHAWRALANLQKEIEAERP